MPAQLVAEEKTASPQVLSPVRERTPLRAVLLLASALAVITFLVHFFSSLWGTHLGYGFFRDELYFLVCGHHLAWGYVDQPPMVAVQARVAEAIFGISPTGIRIFSFAAGGVTVGLTGLLAWQFGGRPQCADSGNDCGSRAPVFLGTANYPLHELLRALLLDGLCAGACASPTAAPAPRAWLLFGLLAGLGVENKHSTGLLPRRAADRPCCSAPSAAFSSRAGARPAWPC